MGGLHILRLCHTAGEVSLTNSASKLPKARGLYRILTLNVHSDIDSFLLESWFPHLRSGALELELACMATEWSHLPLPT